MFSPRINDVPPSAFKAIDLAREAGHKVYLCTGRSLAECEKYINYPVDGFVFAAGAMVYAEHKRIFDHPFAKDEEELVKKLCHEHKMGYAVEGQAGAYCDAFGMDVVLRYFAGDKTEEQERTLNARANGFYPEYYEAEDEKVYKICTYVKHGESFDEFRNSLPKEFALTVTVRDPDFDDCAEVTKRAITKASGIERVLEHYGATKEDAIGIGDSENDLPMIEYCGLGIAMGNAMEIVKERADWVTSDILKDGIWNAFKHAGVIESE